MFKVTNEEELQRLLDGFSDDNEDTIMCPECGDNLHYEEGNWICAECGYTGYLAEVQIHSAALLVAAVKDGLIGPDDERAPIDTLSVAVNLITVAGLALGLSQTYDGLFDALVNIKKLADLTMIKRDVGRWLGGPDHEYNEDCEKCPALSICYPEKVLSRN